MFRILSLDDCHLGSDAVTSPTFAKQFFDELPDESPHVLDMTKNHSDDHSDEHGLNCIIDDISRFCIIEERILETILNLIKIMIHIVRITSIFDQNSIVWNAMIAPCHFWTLCVLDGTLLISDGVSFNLEKVFYNLLD